MKGNKLLDNRMTRVDLENGLVENIGKLALQNTQNSSTSQ